MSYSVTKRFYREGRAVYVRCVVEYKKYSAGGSRSTGGLAPGCIAVDFYLCRKGLEFIDSTGAKVTTELTSYYPVAGQSRTLREGYWRRPPPKTIKAIAESYLNDTGTGSAEATANWIFDTTTDEDGP